MFVCQGVSFAEGQGKFKSEDKRPFADLKEIHKHLSERTTEHNCVTASRCQ